MSSRGRRVDCETFHIPPLMSKRTIRIPDEAYRRDLRLRAGRTRSTQPCIPPGSLNRVPASAGVRAGKSPLPGGR